MGRSAARGCGQCVLTARCKTTGPAESQAKIDDIVLALAAEVAPLKARVTSKSTAAAPATSPTVAVATSPAAAAPTLKLKLGAKPAMDSSPGGASPAGASPSPSHLRLKVGLPERPIADKAASTPLPAGSSGGGGSSATANKGADGGNAKAGDREGPPSEKVAKLKLLPPKAAPASPVTASPTVSSVRAATPASGPTPGPVHVSNLEGQPVAEPKPVSRHARSSIDAILQLRDGCGPWPNVLENRTLVI